MSHMCINNVIFSTVNTNLMLFLSISTYIYCIMVYESLACISAMVSSIESIAQMKGECIQCIHSRALITFCFVECKNVYVAKLKITNVVFCIVLRMKFTLTVTCAFIYLVNPITNRVARGLDRAVLGPLTSPNSVE